MPTTDVSQLKETIRQSFRKACLKRLEGHEADAVKILQEELPPKIKEWRNSDDCAPGEIEHLLSEELARTESSHWVVRETEARVRKSMDSLLTTTQAEAMQSLMAAKVQLELKELKERLDGALGQMLTGQGAEALNGRMAQELSERLRAIVNEAMSSHAQQNTLQVEGIKVALKGAFQETVKANFQEIVAQAQKGFSEDLLGFENRENHRWADRQGSWARMFEGMLKKSELDAALWQAQNAIGERVEGKIRSLDGLSSDVKLLLEERLQKLVTAEAFEARLMASAGMINDSLSKAMQEAIGSLQATLERRLNDTTTPIHQRLSSLITFSDWERVTKDLNEKLVGQLRGEIADALEMEVSKLQAVLVKEQVASNEKLSVQLTGELAKSDNARASTEAARAQALLEELQALRARMEAAEKNSLQVTLLENLRAFSERLASMMIESTEQQRAMLKVAQKEVAEAQTQTLGMMSVQQQNFMGGLQNDWEVLKKTVEDIRARQVVIEAEVSTLQRKLETSLAEVVGKKFKTMRVVTD